MNYDDENDDDNHGDHENEEEEEEEIGEDSRGNPLVYCIQSHGFSSTTCDISLPASRAARITGSC